MTRINFQEIKLSATKSGVCPFCQERARRSITLMNTVNPWNVNAQGLPRTPDQSRAHLREQLAEWRLEPTWHLRCEELDYQEASS